MLKRHEIQVLLKAGHSCSEVARLTGASLPSIYRIRKEGEVEHVDDARARRERGIGRRTQILQYEGQLRQWLEEDPNLLTVELFRRVRGAGYTGGKTAVYEFVATIRPKNVRPMVRFEGLAGEFSQHDFGQVEVRYDDGSTERVHFFASRLKYSRFAQVSLVPNEQVESLVRCLVDHYEGFGGVPLVSVFDRPKTVALRWERNGDVSEWNPTFASVMLQLGVGVELCWPYQPQQKGSVENLVGWVKGSFFKQRRFVDRGDLESQLAQWLEETNTERPSRATGVVPAQRLEEERTRLRSLKVTAQELALRFPVSVNPMAMVVHDNHQYSMPASAIGLPATLWLYRDRVRIVAGSFEAMHRRLDKPGDKSHLPEHRAQAVAAVSGKRAVRYSKREQLLELGPQAHEYITDLIHRRPRLWTQDVDNLYELLQTYGDEPMRQALEHGLRQQTLGSEYIRHYLANPGMLPNGGLQ